MRVTERVIQETALRHLQSQMEALAQVNERIASGKRLNRPADDPAAAEVALSLHADLKTLEAYARTLDLSSGWVAATESALRTLADLVVRSRNVALRGVDATHADVLSELADEAQALFEQAVGVANSRHGDHYIFAGFQTGTEPFSVGAGSPPSVTYAGDGGAMEREIGPGDTVQINVPGDELLPVLNEFAALVDALRSGDTSAVEARLTSLDSALEQIATWTGRIGSAMNRIEEARVRLDQMRLDAQSVLSELEDTDVAEAAVDLNIRERGYLATLAALARSSRATLMEYLR